MAKGIKECCESVAIEDVVVDGKTINYLTPKKVAEMAGISPASEYKASWSQCVFRQCDYRRT